MKEIIQEEARENNISCKRQGIKTVNLANGRKMIKKRGGKTKYSASPDIVLYSLVARGFRLSHPVPHETMKQIYKH